MQINTPRFEPLDYGIIKSGLCPTRELQEYFDDHIAGRPPELEDESAHKSLLHAALRKGDVPGHEFHGNQYTDGSGTAEKDGFTRAEGLNPEQRAIENKAFASIKKNEAALVAKYHVKNKNTIDPDAVKALFPPFEKDPGVAAAVHEPSSYLAKVIYKEALEAKAKAGDTSPTVFTAGGSGSGKSATMPRALAEFNAKDGGLVYDSVMSSSKSAKDKIDAALKITKGNVGIVYTNAPVEKAMVQNALRERSVTINTLALAHAGASETIRELSEHYKDNPRVKILIMNNQGTKADVKRGSLSDVPRYKKEDMRKDLTKTAWAMLKRGEITREKYNLLVS